MDTATRIRQQLAADHRTLRRLTVWLAGAAVAGTAAFAGIAAHAGKTTGTSSPSVATSSDPSEGFQFNTSGFSAGAEAPSSSSGAALSVSGGS